MKKIVFLLLLCSSNVIIAQTGNLANEALEQKLSAIDKQIEVLSSDNKRLTTNIAVLTNRLNAANDTIKSLKGRIQSNTSLISQTVDELGLQIKTTDQTANKRIDEVGNSLSRNSLYGIIGLLVAILASTITYYYLKNKQQADKLDLVGQLQHAKTSIEENLVEQSSKLTELMETQLSIIELQKNSGSPDSAQEVDHSLALKVASEINLIERNISLMDPGTRGLKQLVRSVGKLKDNLAANGYEMPVLLGKPFHEGMKIIVTNSVPDENLEKGSEIISKILIPQVNYNDKMIQTAQIEVSVGI